MREYILRPDLNFHHDSLNESDIKRQFEDEDFFGYIAEEEVDQEVMLPDSFDILECIEENQHEIFNAINIMLAKYDDDCENTDFKSANDRKIYQQLMQVLTNQESINPPSEESIKMFENSIKKIKEILSTLSNARSVIKKKSPNKTIQKIVDSVSEIVFSRIIKEFTKIDNHIWDTLEIQSRVSKICRDTPAIMILESVISEIIVKLSAKDWEKIINEYLFDEEVLMNDLYAIYENLPIEIKAELGFEEGSDTDNLDDYYVIVDEWIFGKNNNLKVQDKISVLLADTKGELLEGVQKKIQMFHQNKERIKVNFKAIKKKQSGLFESIPIKLPGYANYQSRLKLERVEAANEHMYELDDICQKQECFGHEILKNGEYEFSLFMEEFNDFIKKDLDENAYELIQGNLPLTIDFLFSGKIFSFKYDFTETSKKMKSLYQLFKNEDQDRHMTNLPDEIINNLIHSEGILTDADAFKKQFDNYLIDETSAITMSDQFNKYLDAENDNTNNLFTIIQKLLVAFLEDKGFKILANQLLQSKDPKSIRQILDKYNIDSELEHKVLDKKIKKIKKQFINGLKIFFAFPEILAASFKKQIAEIKDILAPANIVTKSESNFILDCTRNPKIDANPAEIIKDCTKDNPLPFDDDVTPVYNAKLFDEKGNHLGNIYILETITVDENNPDNIQKVWHLEAIQIPLRMDWNAGIKKLIAVIGEKAQENKIDLITCNNTDGQISNYSPVQKAMEEYQKNKMGIVQIFIPNDYVGNYSQFQSSGEVAIVWKKQ